MRNLFKAIGVLGVGILMSTAACDVANAGTVVSNCTVFPVIFSGAVGSMTVSCAGFNGALGTLTGAELHLFGDYQFGTEPNTGPPTLNDILINFGVGAPAGVTWADTAPTIDVQGFLSSSTTVPPTLPVVDLATGGVTNANFASAFLVGVSSSIVLGGAATSSGAVQINYIYTTSTVPEPITLSLFGVGLAGAAALRRRNKKLV